MNRTVEVTLVVKDGTRVIPRVAKCPLCPDPFEDHQAILLITDLTEQRQYPVHRFCVEVELDKGPRDNDEEDRAFREYRERLAQRYSPFPV